MKKVEGNAPWTPWAVGLSVFLVAGSTAVVTVLLTSDLTPLGRHLYNLLERADQDPAGGGLHPYQVSLGISLLLIFWGYLVDIHLWRSALKPIVDGYSGLLGLFFLAAVILYSSEAPSIPPLVGVGVGVWLVRALRRSCFDQVPAEEFSSSSAVAYFAIGLLLSVVWLCWAFTPWEGYHNHDWEQSARASLETENFVRWSSPFLLSLVYAMIALFLRWRGRMHTRGKDYVLAELKLICSTFLLLFLFSWLGASIASGDAGLSKVVLRLSVLLSAGAAAYLVATLGKDAIIEACERNPTFSLLMSFLTSEWVKGAFILICLPLVPLFIAVEVVHNAVRAVVQRCAVTGRKPGTWITDEAASVLAWIETWHIASVLAKSMWVGIIYFTLQVGCARGIVVLLAWVCERSLGFSWAGVVFILYALGTFLFLLPPVPGCPIYMVASILMTKRMEATGGSFLLAALFSLILSMVIKLSAVAMQQKLIGEPFSDSIWVKKFVSIHTPEMKAIRYILSQDGMRMDKVIVLVCGPDWPTSVLTGILKLPVLDMLLGTLPMVFLILPFSLAGSFMVHASAMPDDDVGKRRLKGLGSALLFLSMLSQMAGMMLIFQYTNSTVEKFKDEIAEGKWMCDPQEGEVMQAVEKEEEQKKRRQEATRWSVLPWWMKANLLLGTALMSMMMHIIILPFMKPFKDFSLQDKFSDIGDVSFLINKPGWVAIASLCCSVVCLTIFEIWCLRAAPTADEQKPLRAAAAGPAGSYNGASA